MSNFASQMKQFENMTEKKAEKVFRKTCFEISNEVISNTPVDSGRAKNNWFPDINRFSTEMTETTNKQGSINLVTNATPKLKIGDTFTLSNNLPYIVRLEYGWSKQKPNGFVAIAIQKFDTILKNVNKGTK